MEQQPVPQNFFQKNKLPLGISSVVLVFLIIGGIYFFENKLTQPTANPISDTENNTKASTPQMQAGNFEDDELGISFYAPKNWGKATIKNDFSSTQILREITFSNQPNVKLVSFTEHRLYPA